MDLENRMRLVSRPPTEEIVQPHELERIFENVSKPKHYIGLEISGKLHLGSLILTGYKINDFLKANIDCNVFLADWHTYINNKLEGDWEKITEVSNYYSEAFKFFCPGVNVILGTAIYDSSHDYWKNLIQYSKFMTLPRTLRALTIMGRSRKDNLDLSQLLYPSMQSVDIRTLDLDIVHAGMDQRKIHMLVREIFPKLMWKVPVSVHHHLLPGLEKPSKLGLTDSDEDFHISSKMSKSKPNSSISIHDDELLIKDKIAQAYCPPGVLLHNPVLEIIRYVLFREFGEFQIERSSKYGGDISYDNYVELEDDYKSLRIHPVDLKNAASRYLNKIIDPNILENSCDILITNASTIIPLVGKIDTNILIEDGKIKAVRKSIENVQASRVINASKKYVLPGIIDPHVHYGVFTPIDSSAVTESRSAAVGGICTIMRMLRMHGTFKNIFKHLEASGKKHLVDYQIHASILNNLQLKEMQFLSNLGINSYKLYMNLGSDMKQILADLEPGKYELDEIEVNMTEKLVFDIVRNAAFLNSLLLVHSEDHEECSKFMKDNNQTRNARKNRLLELWSNCRPTSSEVVSIQKVTDMASRCGTDLYFVHIGSSDALQAIVKSRDIYKNRSFWAETCPHYLTHTSEYDNLKGKVVPPLRSKDDVSTLWNAIRMGLLDTIGTDHVANTLETKIIQDDLWKSRSGFPGLATMLPVLLSEGVNKNRISLEKLSEICSFNPSRIFRMFPKKGTIQRDSDADLTIIDLEKEQIVTPEIMQSYSDYTIYEGWNLRGWPVMTIVRGKPIMEDGYVDDQAIGHGKFVRHEGSLLSTI